MDKKNLAIFFIVLVVVLASMIYSMGGLGRYSVLSGPFIIIWIFIAGSVFWFVFTNLSKKEIEKPNAFLPDRYRTRFAIVLTVIALLSILLLSSKTVQTGRMPDGVSYSIIPPVIVVSAITIFVALTTYNKKLYPHSTIFASILLVMVYTTSLSEVFHYFPNSALGFLSGSWIATIPVIVMAASWLHGKGLVYPSALSIIFGIFTGVVVPIGYEGFEMFATTLPAIPLMIFTGIIFIISAIFKSEAVYLKSARTVILVLVIYLIAQFLSYTTIFRPFYLSL
ncbi:MAG: hypothetical protein PHU34_07815 [Candidatus Methanoperedens sp.]|nr:hypothetical protein [Candidatus Methanoperedens sp.]